ncbi:Transmembrane channel-like protein 7 [Lamellibrachia satsuma]|nr:Transmembrane channel-like protein 7 [Lamellibrachia satsuma]
MSNPSKGKGDDGGSPDKQEGKKSVNRLGGVKPLRSRHVSWKWLEDTATKSSNVIEDDDVIPEIPSRRWRSSYLKQRRQAAGIEHSTRRAASFTGLRIDDKILEMAREKGLLIERDGSARWTESERIRQIEIIRQMPVSMQLRRHLRALVFKYMSEEKREGCVAYIHNLIAIMSLWGSRRLRVLRELHRSLALWRGHLRNIECHFGGGVLTYFLFLRWLLKVNFYLFFIVMTFVAAPFFIWPATHVAANETDFTPYDHSTPLVNRSFDGCIDVMHRGSIIGNDTLIQASLDLITGSGFLVEVPFFYGGFDKEVIEISDSQGNVKFHYNFPLAYFLTIIGCLFFSLSLIVHKVAQGARENMFYAPKLYRPSCNQVFGSWDFTITDEDSSQLQSKNIYREIQLSLKEQREEIRCRNRPILETYIVYSIRLFVNLVVVSVLVGCGVLLRMTFSHSAELRTKPAVSRLDRLIQNYQGSICMGLVNNVIPHVFRQLAKYERYRAALEVNVTLTRIVILRLGSLIVLLETLLKVVGCDIKCTDVSHCHPIRCWETFVAQEFFRLVVMELFSQVFVIFVIEFPRRFLVTSFPNKLTHLIGLQEFDIPKNVLDLIYSQTLFWLGAVFNPMMTVIAIVRLFIMFHLKKFTVLSNHTPPTRSHRVSESNSFFSTILLGAYFTCMIPIIYVITKMETSTSCGPFRHYKYMYYALKKTMDDSSAFWVHTVAELANSAAFLVPLLIFLTAMSYYLYYTTRTLRTIIQMLRDQLIVEGHDKVFLMRRLQQHYKSSLHSLYAIHYRPQWADGDHLTSETDRSSGDDRDSGSDGEAAKASSSTTSVEGEEPGMRHRRSPPSQHDSDEADQRRLVPQVRPPSPRLSLLIKPQSEQREGYSRQSYVPSEDEAISWRWRSYSDSRHSADRPGDRLIELASSIPYQSVDVELDSSRHDVDPLRDLPVTRHSVGLNTPSLAEYPPYSGSTASRHVVGSFATSPVRDNFATSWRDEEQAAPPGGLAETPPERPRWISRYLDSFV